MSAAPKKADSDSEVLYLRRRRYARTMAMRYLYQADVNSDWSMTAESETSFWDQGLELEDALEGKDLEAARDYARTLIQGVIKHLPDLDARITACAQNWRLDRMGIVDRNLLRLAAFEITAVTDVPAAVAMNEAIELAKEFGDKDSGRFINGILDRLAREHVQPV